MRVVTKPSTACCNQDIYISYLLSDPHYTSCTRLSDILQSVSHDSVHRFLERERFEPEDLFAEEKDKIELVGGIKPAWITGDSWYSGNDNLKFIRKLNMNFLFGIENNRLISIDRGKYIQIQTLEDWPHDGKSVYLKEYGVVRVFRQLYKKVYRYYILGVAQLDDLDGLCQSDFERVHAAHWCIERYHRAIKQVCNIERFQVRRENPIKNHVFCALKAFVRLEFMRFDNLIPHWYEIQKQLFVETIRNFIANPGKYHAVNA